MAADKNRVSETGSDMSLVFLALYMVAALIQVGTLLTLANWLVDYLWTKNIDPDSAAIPYLTSLGDLFGGALLSSAVYLEYYLLQQ